MPPVVPLHPTNWLTRRHEALHSGSGKPCLMGITRLNDRFLASPCSRRARLQPLADRSGWSSPRQTTRSERLYRDTSLFPHLSGTGDDLALFPKRETLPYESTVPTSIWSPPHAGDVAPVFCTTARTVLFTSVPALTQRVLRHWCSPMPCFAFNPTEHHGTGHARVRPLRLGYRKGSVVEISANSASAEASSTFTRRPIPIRWWWSFGDTIESIRFSIRPPKVDRQDQAGLGTTRAGIDPS